MALKKVSQRHQFLEPIGTVAVPATTQLVAKYKFVENAAQKGAPRILFRGSNFKEWFLRKTEKPMGETTLRVWKLVELATDKAILDELGDKAAETTLAQVYSLLERQPNGEEGVLLTDGGANIFYVPDVTGTRREVFVRWLSDGWYANASLVEHPNRWSDGDRVFSRNS